MASADTERQRDDDSMGSAPSAEPCGRDEAVALYRRETLTGAARPSALPKQRVWRAMRCISNG